MAARRAVAPAHDRVPARLPNRATAGEERLWLVPEAAEYLRLHPTKVYALIRTGELPAVVLNPRRIRVRRTDLDRWLDDRTTGGAA